MVSCLSQDISNIVVLTAAGARAQAPTTKWVWDCDPYRDTAQLP